MRNKRITVLGEKALLQECRDAAAKLMAKERVII
jgi:hypothetical protein